MSGERLCFVQFIHPGGEHGADEDGLKHWNRDAHRRKFLKVGGRCVDAADGLHDDDIVFWGEWEPPSRVESVESPLPFGPRFLHAPFLPPRSPSGWRQNTDPFVFGPTFHYTGCLQHTSHGPTQLRYLARGSVVLFGSARARRLFTLDTVLVVDRWLEHSAIDYRRLRADVSDAYWRATVEPWYSGAVDPAQSHRLYVGATYDAPLAGMFSFFPCAPVEDAIRGFARPMIDLPDAITPTLTQGKRLNPQPDIASARSLFNEVVRQVRHQGLLLGIRAELPPIDSSSRADNGSWHARRC